ncbi:hypothetical protein [Trichoplusia ni ascovirus 2c]|uniref:hypothetical protein n=1 Tax=Trichoplusia ni ascovirus 2c TaxID=328615 RepID=UPI0000E44270|nr:hypothetical protein TNAV2c_gp156 [Trichoplusia ni ascovirus 2c]ABF70671.1 hypothetical protein [Trichoplusia ni ascovirus 2c]AUS94264.1 hypothetical protein [Trichoplusia ni ascovirus 6b]
MSSNMSTTTYPRVPGESLSNMQNEIDNDLRVRNAMDQIRNSQQQAQQVILPPPMLQPQIMIPQQQPQQYQTAQPVYAPPPQMPVDNNFYLPINRNVVDTLLPYKSVIPGMQGLRGYGDPAKMKYYDPVRDGYFMYNMPNGTVDRSLWRFIKPTYWFSFLTHSREHYCRKCCSYRDYWWTSKYKDDPRFDNFQCQKASCETIPNARACQNDSYGGGYGPKAYPMMM